MYYAVDLFLNKGALGKIWLAGTVFRKLNKKAILESDIKEFCNQVMKEGTLAISTCGCLTLGIVRIHDKCLQYLLEDANDANVRLKRIDLSTNKLILTRDPLASAIEKVTMFRKEVSLDDLVIEPEGLLSKEAQKIEKQRRYRERMQLTLEDEDLMLEEMRPLMEKQGDISLENIFEAEDEIDATMIDVDQLYEKDDSLLDLGLPEPAASSSAIRLLPDMTPSAVSMQSKSLAQAEIGLPVSELSLTAQEEERKRIEEEPAGTATPPPAVPKSKSRKRKRPQYGWPESGRLRFPRDAQIEFKRNENLIQDNEWDSYTIQRPAILSLAQKEPETGENERLLRSSELLGEFSDDTELSKKHEQLMGYLLDARLGRQRVRLDGEQLSDVVPEISDIPMARRDESEGTPAIMDITAIQKEKSIASSTTDVLFGKDISMISTLPSAKRPRLMSPVSSILEEKMVSAIEEKRGDEGITTSATEQFMQQSASRLTLIYYEMIKEEFEKLSVEKKKEGKVSMEGLFKKQAQENNAVLSKRDVSRGFMQSLILKNADVIDLKQKEPYGDILITKGTGFNANINIEVN